MTAAGPARRIDIVSLDGVMEDPRWTFRFMSEERENFKYQDPRARAATR
jgi:hypothetical protein